MTAVGDQTRLPFLLFSSPNYDLFVSFPHAYHVPVAVPQQLIVRSVRATVEISTLSRAIFTKSREPFGAHRAPDWMNSGSAGPLIDNEASGVWGWLRIHLVYNRLMWGFYVQEQLVTMCARHFLYCARGMNITEAGDAGVTCFPIFPAVVVPSSLLWPTTNNQTPLWLMKII